MLILIAFLSLSFIFLPASASEIHNSYQQRTRLIDDSTLFLDQLKQDSIEETFSRAEEAFDDDDLKNNVDGINAIMAEFIATGRVLDKNGYNMLFSHYDGVRDDPKK